MSLFHCYQEHTGRVFRLQFDEFQIVSSSHDDTILIWDFLNCSPSEASGTPVPGSTSNPSGTPASIPLPTRSPSRKLTKSYLKLILY